jgi:hypothetical protein
VSDDYETPTSRIIILGLAFAALVAIGVVTVLRPELEQEPDAAASVEDTSAPQPDGVAATPTPAP